MNKQRPIIKSKAEISVDPVKMNAFLSGNKDCEEVPAFPASVTRDESRVVGAEAGKIKTFPVPMTAEFHRMLQRVAFEQGISIKSYILDAVREKMQRDGVE